MNILDAVIIIFLIVGILAGFRRGFIKQCVLLVGLVVTIVLAFNLRIPVSTFLYKHLPFFSFGGIFKGVSVLNILLYEVIAFLIVFSILYLILRIILKISGLIEGILKATIILGFFSKIAGGIVGFIEGYIITFILLFIFSKLSDRILNHTPVMTEAVSNTSELINEIEELSDRYKNNSKDFNNEAIELFLKYKIVTQDNIDYLKEKGKLD